MKNLILIFLVILFSSAASANPCESIMKRLLKFFKKAEKPLIEQARALNGGDLFNQVFKGNLDEMVTQSVFRNEELYGYGREPLYRFWWTKNKIKNSRSPVPMNLAGQHGKENVERIVYWPNRNLSSKAAPMNYQPDMKNYRVAVNRYRNQRGEWVDDTAEVIGYNSRTGEYVPFLYKNEGGKWVIVDTYRGEPVRKGCIKCHSNPGSDVFLPLPGKVKPVKSVDDLINAGYRRDIADSFYNSFHGQ